MENESDVRKALELIYLAALSPNEHRLLSLFVLDSVDPRTTALYLLQRASAGTENEYCLGSRIESLLSDWKELLSRFRLSHKISPLVRTLGSSRDGKRCCVTKRSSPWWDMLCWSRIGLFQIVPGQLVSGYNDQSNNPLREVLSVFLSEARLQRVLQSVGDDSNMKDQLRNHWMLDQNVATAFKNGQIYLEAECDPEEDSDDDSPQTNYYTLQMTLPRPFPVLTNDKGRPIYLNDDVAISCNDPQTLPAPSAFFIGVHAQFCKSLRCMQIQKENQKGWPVNSLGHRVQSAIPRGLWHKIVFSITRVWLYFPSVVRATTYQLLLYFGLKIWGRQLNWVQRVPFGLYIKHGPGKFVPNGEGPALRLVEQHVNVPAPKIIEVLTTTDHTYLVMTRLPGVPLDTALYYMSYPERAQLEIDLRELISQFRSIPNPNPTAICSADGGPVFDYRLPGSSKLGGPFQSETEFNNHIGVERLENSTLELSHEIYFTHADLNPTNILISAGKLSGIVDFGLAGFYPEYWEYTKGVYTIFGPDTGWLDILSRVFSEAYTEELKVERRLWEVTPPW